MSVPQTPEEMKKLVHKILVLKLVMYVGAQGWQVTHASDIEGLQQPFAISGEIPDMIATNGKGGFAVGEVETCESLRHERTMLKFRVFSRMRVEGTGEDMPFFILVPEQCLDQLQTIIRERFTPGNSVALYLPLPEQADAKPSG